MSFATWKKNLLPTLFILLACGAAVRSAQNHSSTSADAQFARDAAAGGIAEVKLGQLALQNASSSEVKAFGQLMVTDHTKGNADLKKVAGAQQITLPTVMSDKDQALFDQLSSLKGNDFNEAYTKVMLEDHKKDVSDFEKEAAEDTNDALKQFANRTLPTLRDHLKKIEIVSRSLTIEKPSA